MGTQEVYPYFYIMLGGVKRVTDICLSRLSMMEPYSTSDGRYARIHTGIFRRLNVFWFWVITDLLEKDLRSLGFANVNHCAQQLAELFDAQCNDLESWMRAESEAEKVWCAVVPGSTIDYSLIIGGLEKMGKIEMANEAKRAQVAALLITALRRLAAAFRLAFQAAEMPNKSDAIKLKTLWMTGNNILSATEAIMYLASPGLLNLKAGEQAGGMETITAISVVASVTSWCTSIFDKLCELELLRRDPL